MSTIPSAIGSSSQVPHVSDTPSPEGKAVNQYDEDPREAIVNEYDTAWRAVISGRQGGDQGEGSVCDLYTYVRNQYCHRRETAEAVNKERQSE